MDIIIEKANSLSSAKKCDKLLQKMLKNEHTFDNLVNPDFKVEKFFEKCINNPSQILLIAKNEEKIVGFLHGFIKQMPMQFFKAGILQLNIMFVNEKHRSLGVGTLLLNKFVQIAKENGFDNIEVITSINNTVAQNFYKKHNFLPINYELRKKL